MTSRIENTAGEHKLTRTPSETNLAEKAKQFSRDKLHKLEKDNDTHNQSEQRFLSFDKITGKEIVKDIISKIADKIIDNPKYSGLKAKVIVEMLKKFEQNIKLPLSELAKEDSSVAEASPKAFFRDKSSIEKLKHALLDTFHSTYQRIPAGAPESLQLAFLATKLLAKQIVIYELVQSALDQKVSSEQRAELLKQWADLNNKQKIFDYYIKEHYPSPQEEREPIHDTNQVGTPIAEEATVKRPTDSPNIPNPRESPVDYDILTIDQRDQLLLDDPSLGENTYRECLDDPNHIGYNPYGDPILSALLSNPNFQFEFV